MSADFFSRSALFWGAEKQQRIKNASILVAGIGGLGGAVAGLLVRAGVGRLILIDNQTVTATDIGRHSLFTKTDIGLKKVNVAAARLASIHGQTEIIPLDLEIADHPHFFAAIARHPFRIIADCLDNLAARTTLEKTLLEKQFLVHGGVQNDYGQVTTVAPGRTPRLAEIFSGQEDSAAPLPVSPMAVAILGGLQTQEILNTIWDRPQLLNALLVMELADFSLFKIPLAL